MHRKACLIRIVYVFPQGSTEVGYETFNIWYARDVESFLNESSGQTATEVHTNTEGARRYEVSNLDVYTLC